MKNPVTPFRLEEALTNYLFDVKHEKSAHRIMGYIQQYRNVVSVIDEYHAKNPGKRDKEKDYIRAASEMKKRIDEEYKR